MTPVAEWARKSSTFLALVLAAASVAACRDTVAAEPPILLQRDLFAQAKYKPQGYAAFYPDHGAMRPPVENTIPRETFEDEDVATGVLADGSGYALTIPDAVVTRAGGLGPLVARGRERFDIYCAPCHSRTGDGRGMIARAPQAFPPLPNLASPALCQLPDGQLFATISNGVRNMPAYGSIVPVPDRWAIVGYVRALQLSLTAAGGSK